MYWDFDDLIDISGKEAVTVVIYCVEMAAFAGFQQGVVKNTLIVFHQDSVFVDTFLFSSQFNGIVNLGGYLLDFCRFFNNTFDESMKYIF